MLDDAVDAPLLEPDLLVESDPLLLPASLFEPDSLLAELLESPDELSDLVELERDPLSFL